MALKKNARYAFGLNYLRVRPLNADLSQPEANNLIGGAGPFDFSGASSAAAVPFVVKIDGGEEKDLTADLSAAVAIAAVTGAVDQGNANVRAIVAGAPRTTPEVRP